jgi:ubiquinol-cytochrome c reductase cytochrome c1 subunit
MKKLLLALLFAPMTAMSAGVEVKLDRAPDRSKDLAALQHGAKLFVNYCLNCHSASYMRYNRLEDIGLTDQQIKDNLLFTADKVGEPMKVAMQAAEARQWFGAAPPDLTVIARSRASGAGTGADWLYTYLRGFHRDESRPTGWNNTVFENVGMPHVLYDLQGEQVLRVSHDKDAHGHTVTHKTLELAKPGPLTPEQYDAAVADLVAFLVYMGEPAAESRKQIGLGVLIALTVLGALAYALKKNYWKDVH